MEVVRQAFEAAPLVGRDAERRFASRVLRGPARRALVVAGPAGVGKSRLADELGAAAAARGSEVCWLRATPWAAASPLGAIAPLLPARELPVSRPSDLVLDAADALLDGTAGRLLVIDDAHLLDPASAAALHLAASRGPMAMVLTLRIGEPVDPAVVALWKDGFAERLDLAPLDRRATDALAASLLGAPLDGVSAGDLYTASQGNPLFVRELLVGALDERRVVRQGAVFRFVDRPRSSARLAELLADRLDDVSGDELAALEVLAVAEELGLGALQQLSAAATLQRLEQLGLVVVDIDERRRPVRLSHPLYRELLVARMGRIRELAVHRTLADHLESLGARRQRDLLALARWRLVGGGDLDAATWVAAARQAFVRYDLELAVELAGAAGRAGAGAPADIVAAQALLQLGRQRDAADRLRATLEAATDGSDIVAAAIDLSVVQFWSFGDEGAALATVAAASARVDGDDRARIDAHLASFEAMANRPEAALARVAPHLERGEGLPYLLAVVAAAPALGAVGRAEEVLALVDRCLPVRASLGDDQVMPDVYKYLVSRVFALSELGPLDEAASFAREVYELAASVRAVQGVAWAAMLEGRVALVAGDLGAAAGSFAESSGLFADLSEHGLRSWSLAGEVLAAAMAGDAEAAAVHLAALEAVPPNPVKAMQADLDRSRAWASWCTGDPPLARRQLDAAIALSVERGSHGHGLALVHDVARLGHADAAASLVPGHRRVQGRLAAARLAFIDALAAGDGDALDLAAARFTEVAAPLFAAEAASAAAAAHRRAGSSRSAARSERAAAAHAATCPSAATPLVRVGPQTAGLTARERTVAELAAAGLSSREIAAELGRSVRTVDNHLQRAYDKLGVGSRKALAAVLGIPD